ncbi:hypothetical protein T492DRAFT_872909 [Pavlovales sp. CCMP2436]|nr:hypothetical protein T492DRAFT_872909 [Pavlovales sp. CCMP2436]
MYPAATRSAAVASAGGRVVDPPVQQPPPTPHLALSLSAAKLHATLERHPTAGAPAAERGWRVALARRRGPRLCEFLAAFARTHEPGACEGVPADAGRALSTSDEQQALRTPPSGPPSESFLKEPAAASRLPLSPVAAPIPAGNQNVTLRRVHTPGSEGEGRHQRAHGGAVEIGGPLERGDDGGSSGSGSERAERERLGGAPAPSGGGVVPSAHVPAQAFNAPAPPRADTLAPTHARRLFRAAADAQTPPPTGPGRGTTPGAGWGSAGGMHVPFLDDDGGLGGYSRYAHAANEAVAAVGNGGSDRSHLSNGHAAADGADGGGVAERLNSAGSSTPTGTVAGDLDASDGAGWAAVALVWAAPVGEGRSHSAFKRFFASCLKLLDKLPNGSAPAAAIVRAVCAAAPGSAGMGALLDVLVNATHGATHGAHVGGTLPLGGSLPAGSHPPSNSFSARQLRATMRAGPTAAELPPSLECLLPALAALADAVLVPRGRAERRAAAPERAGGGVADDEAQPPAGNDAGFRPSARELARRRRRIVTASGSADAARLRHLLATLLSGWLARPAELVRDAVAWPLAVRLAAARALCVYLEVVGAGALAAAERVAAREAAWEGVSPGRGVDLADGLDEHVSPRAVRPGVHFYAAAFRLLSGLSGPSARGRPAGVADSGPGAVANAGGAGGALPERGHSHALSLGGSQRRGGSIGGADVAAAARALVAAERGADATRGGGGCGGDGGLGVASGTLGELPTLVEGAYVGADGGGAHAHTGGGGGAGGGGSGGGRAGSGTDGAVGGADGDGGADAGVRGLGAGVGGSGGTDGARTEAAADATDAEAALLATTTVASSLTAGALSELGLDGDGNDANGGGSAAAAEAILRALGALGADINACTAAETLAPSAAAAVGACAGADAPSTPSAEPSPAAAALRGALELRVLGGVAALLGVGPLADSATEAHVGERLCERVEEWLAAAVVLPRANAPRSRVYAAAVEAGVAAAGGALLRHNPAALDRAIGHVLRAVSTAATSSATPDTERRAALAQWAVAAVSARALNDAVRAEPGWWAAQPPPAGGIANGVAAPTARLLLVALAALVSEWLPLRREGVALCRTLARAEAGGLDAGPYAPGLLGDAPGMRSAFEFEALRYAATLAHAHARLAAPLFAELADARAELSLGALSALLRLALPFFSAFAAALARTAEGGASGAGAVDVRPLLAELRALVGALLRLAARASLPGTPAGGPETLLHACWAALGSEPAVVAVATPEVVDIILAHCTTGWPSATAVGGSTAAATGGGDGGGTETVPASGAAQQPPAPAPLELCRQVVAALARTPGAAALFGELLGRLRAYEPRPHAPAPAGGAGWLRARAPAAPAPEPLRASEACALLLLLDIAREDDSGLLAIDGGGPTSGARALAAVLHALAVFFAHAADAAARRNFGAAALSDVARAVTMRALARVGGTRAQLRACAAAVDGAIRTLRAPLATTGGGASADAAWAPALLRALPSGGEGVRREWLALALRWAMHARDPAVVHSCVLLVAALAPAPAPRCLRACALLLLASTRELMSEAALALAALLASQPLLHPAAAELTVGGGGLTGRGGDDGDSDDSDEQENALRDKERASAEWEPWAASAAAGSGGR